MKLIDHLSQPDLAILPFWEGVKSASDHPFSDALAPLLQGGDFKGKQAETAWVYPENGPKRLLVLGLGNSDKVTPESLRRAFASAVRAAHGKKTKAVSVYLPKSRLSENDLLHGVVEGLTLTNYAFSKLKGESAQKESVLIEQAALIGLAPHAFALIEKIQVLTKAAHKVRDWVNDNADDVTPEKLAEIARGLALEASHLSVEIFDKKDLEREKMGLILAVNRGSQVEPRLIQLKYSGNPESKETIILVGKGITYDTGGLSIKPTDGMLTMKSDMAGGATVLASVFAAASLKLKVNVTALVPAAENAIGSKSYKLGDVYRSYSGKTVEINNTDAEGRLVLADAISYAVQKLKPTALIDVATLTGSIIMALGEEMAGMFANDEAVANDLLYASERTGEQLWRMPLNPDYKDALRSEYGDLVNSGGRDAGAMKGGLFLQEFVGNTPWAHLDVAGPCFVNRPKHYWTTKATGFGVRLLVEFLEKRAHS